MESKPYRTMSDERKLFRRWSWSMETLAVGPDAVEQYILEAWRDSWVEPWALKRWYRGGGHEENPSGVVWAYVARSLGHRLDRALVLRFPRVAALFAGVFFDGRWRDCEDAVGGDRCASYLYSLSMGRRVLPWAMHNRMVMEGLFSDSPWVRRYVDEICGGSAQIRRG